MSVTRTTTTTTSHTRLWTALRDQLRAARTALTARQALERDLAGYTSQSDLDDLYAMLDRYGDRETAQIRRILAARHA
jgi:hypothetical protein